MPGPLQLKFLHFPKGSLIVVEGKLDIATQFYIIKEGKVFISRKSEVVADEGSGLLCPGDFFGVVATMSGHPHIETAQALTECILITVDRSQFVPLLQLNAPIAMKIILQFSRRMRFLDNALAERTFRGGAAESDSLTQIFNVAEYYTRQGSFLLAFYAYSKFIAAAPPGPNAAVARERLTKIAPYVKDAVLEPDKAEFNRVYPKDTMIFAEGESGDELFIIKTGAVKIVKIVDNNEVLIALLRDGDIFGEMALLESKPRAACAIAYAPCTMMAVNRGNFERLVENQPQMIARLTTMLAERIWLIYKQLTNTLIKNPLGRVWDALLIQLLRAGVPLNMHAPYEFDFGAKELINMVGLSKNDGNALLQKVFEKRKVLPQKDRIVTTDVMEIVRQADIFVKMEQREAARKMANK